jgi:hypothetical protein
VNPTHREERLANNEALFRAANERMAGWEEQHAATETELYFCECSDPECREKLALTRVHYERVRSNPRHFALLEGHEILDVETVVHRDEGWLIVEKPPELDDTIEPLDPRSRGR